MAVISSNFNRFYHKVILIDFYNRCSVVKFPGWVDTDTGRCFEFIKGEHFGVCEEDGMDELKQLLKNMCSIYPIDGDKKMSTSKIDSKALMMFIEWVFRLASYNHIEMEIVEREWRELLENN